MTKQKHLSAREKAKILTRMASGASATAAAAAVKRNRRTVRKFLNQPEAKAALADMFERTARQALDHIEPEKLATSNALQLATVAGIATDKMRLLRNEPTTISVDYLLAAVGDIRAMREAQDGGVRLSLPAEAQAAAPDPIEPMQQPAIVKPDTYKVERHSTKYYSVQNERQERRFPLQADPDPE